ncbi:spore germination protein [Paenibacillus athensensis]|uniref:Spore germination protein n=1 Tax=Paenibacillus athensensis TaxID=1967502 RepID=A0A4Y8Q1R1_9BACL|nr:spore germination protein [Paenibacillus athensensis]MCD1258323.1 spore germination protein [Paenibacillus athensensis]
MSELFGRISKQAQRAEFAYSEPDPDGVGEPSLPTSLHEVEAQLHEQLGESPDIKQRVLTVDLRLKLLVVYTEGLSNPKHLLETLVDAELTDGLSEPAPSEVPDRLKQTVIAEGPVADIRSMMGACRFILSGYTVIFIEGSQLALAVGTKELKQRPIEEPITQSVVRGPREGFTESLRENTALVRRRIKDPRLRLEQMLIGSLTSTDVGMMYMKEIARAETVEDVRRQLQQIDIESVLESSYIEEMLQVDKPYSLFPTIFNTERPDVVAAALLEGRIAIFVEGTPFVLLVPALFVHFFQSGEDYYQRFDFSTLIRLLRFMSMLLTLLMPSLYIAVTTFHQEMLPTTLLLSLMSQREGVPFPAFIESLIMEVTFEILREAGVRMPKSIGQSVSIVGTLVIGQAAVEAGLVSAAMVIVVSVTAISNFVLPAFNIGISTRMLRFVFMGLAAIFGLYGIFLGIIVLLLHLASMESFGIPYMSTLASFQLGDQKDSLFRLPLWFRPGRSGGSGRSKR